MQMARAGVPAGDVWTDPDLANASYDSVSFSVATEDASPFDCFFKPDGTKMYVVGQGNDALYQYTLSTAWDLSSASYDSVSFSLSTQDTGTLGVFFKPDGTKFYIAGNANNSVFEYNLSTAWDISTASYSTNSFSVTSQDATPAGVFFREDGLRMFVVGLQNNSVYQYTLSSAWDVSTASYDTKLLSVATQSTGASGLFFNPDGTKVWVTATVGDNVYQYTLSTAWDISTATYDSISFDVSAQDGGPRGFFFKPDGSKMYLVGSVNDTIYQYSTD
jgi:DNA-binding beta-propeller fold protein YncE